jgi:hypothetical protein
MQADVLRAQLIGVGENAHGELVSWSTRLRLLRAALRRFPDDPIVVFVEQMHPYLAAMNTPGAFHVDHGFHPHLMVDANRSIEHLAIHKKLRKLSAAGRVVFVGVDVQIVRFPHLWSALPGGDRKVDAIIRKVATSHGRGFVPGDGADRNRRQAAIIAEVMRELRTGPAPCFFWAHNEHVAYGSANTRADKQYRVEGDLLRQVLAYKSVLTYSPRLWHVWGGATKPKEMVEPSAATRRFFSRTPRTVRMANVDVVLSELFTSTDADWVVAIPTSPKLTLSARVATRAA